MGEPVQGRRFLASIRFEREDYVGEDHVVMHHDLRLKPPVSELPESGSDDETVILDMSKAKID